MVVLKQEGMNKLLFIFCVTMLFSCGSKKKFNKIDSVENITSVEQLHAILHGKTRVLEFIDVIIRQVETRDSSGNTRIETKMEISKKTEKNKQDSTRITATRQETMEEIVNEKTNEKRSGIIGSWVRVVGFVSGIIVALVIGIYMIKKRLIKF